MNEVEYEGYGLCVLETLPSRDLVPSKNEVSQ